MIIINSLAEKIIAPQGNEKHITVFCKALYGFLLLKIVFLWPLVEDIQTYKHFSFNSELSYFLFAPLWLTKIQNELFLIVFIFLLLSGLALRINYFTGLLVCWFSISLSRLFLPIINGSDLVLNLFLIVAIGLVPRPKFRFVKDPSLQVIVANTALIFAQIQFALIYLLSGYDKLISEAWRSGAAIDSIDNLKFFHNPWITLELNQTACLILSWMVILFELIFPLLIWFRYFRKPLLAAGVIFHLLIAIYLGLIDFALVMIICYGVFLPFKKTETHDPAVLG